MNKPLQAKFQIGDILPIAITLVVAGIAIAFGVQTQDEIGDDIGDSNCDYYWTGTQCQFNTTNTTVMSGNPASFNVSGDAIDAVGTLAEKLPLIATVVAAAIIIGVLLRYLMMR